MQLALSQTKKTGLHAVTFITSSLHLIAHW